MIPPLTDRDDQQIALEEVIRKIHDLPSLPQVEQALLEKLNDDNLSLEHIVEKVALDPSLAAKVLKLANTSYYGTNSKVVTIQQAVSMLGTSHLKSLIRTSIFNKCMPSKACSNFDAIAFWRHNIATAICAELISRTLHMKHDFAFTAGLLHDIGRLALASCFPAQYDQAIRCCHQKDCGMLEAERAVLGIDHVAAGQILAIEWQFSEAIQDAIRGHHEPTANDLNSLASVIHVANAIVHALDVCEEKNEYMPSISDDAWKSLALTEMQLLTIFHETELRFAAMNQIIQ